MPKLISKYGITRGDTLLISRRLTDNEGNVLNVNPATDAINFTIRKNMDSEVLLHKDLTNGIVLRNDGIFDITILPKDTESMGFGTYGFDIEVTIGKEEDTPFVRTVNSGTIELLEDDYSRPEKEGV